MPEIYYKRRPDNNNYHVKIRKKGVAGRYQNDGLPALKSGLATLCRSHEDAATVRKDFAADNLSRLKKIALNVLRLENATATLCKLSLAKSESSLLGVEQAVVSPAAI
jgi:hypothetical protein